MRAKREGLKLPANLLDEIITHGAVKNPDVGLTSRRQKRKRDRKPRKERPDSSSSWSPLKSHHRRHKIAGLSQRETAASGSPIVLDEDARHAFKSVSKVGRKQQEITQEADGLELLASQSKSIPRGLVARLAKDDAEITALEKKLGINGKKGISPEFIDDGLNEILEGLKDIKDGKSFGEENKQSAGDSWLALKRTETKIFRQDEKQLVGNTVFSTTSLSEGKSLNKNTIISASSTSVLEDGFEELESEPTATSSKPSRENPYRAPLQYMDSASQKYVPPSLREPMSSPDIRLRRQIQGLINRLTDANLVSIVGNIEELYRENIRQHVTSALLDALLAPVCESTRLSDILIILTAGFIAAIYKVIGTDFGAQATERVVKLFGQHHSQTEAPHDKTCSEAKSDVRKETSNLITLLAELYNFQVVGSNLIFDYIRFFLNDLSELNTELLLRIIQVSGHELRQDDPSSLRDIVSMLRPAAYSLGDQSIPVRMKFMIERIHDLKNNRIKPGAATSLTFEHTVRMKKTLGVLNSRILRAVEPLRIGLEDIQDSENKGRWWLVGARWNGKGLDSTGSLDSGLDVNHKNIAQPASEKTDRESDLLQLAREHRMNTDIRRAIFITIMSASDCQEAYIRLTKLKLKKIQELEIPKVLIHCLSAEDRYNPYYTLIAKKLCGDRKLRMAFQFWIWNHLQRASEDTDDVAVKECGAEEILSTRPLVHVAKMFGSLIAGGSLSLGVLRNFNFGYIQQQACIFVELLLITIFLQAERRSDERRDEQAIVKIVSQVKDTPQMIGGLRYFLKKYVAKTDVAGGKAETSTVKWACTVATTVLDSMYSATT